MSHPKPTHLKLIQGNPGGRPINQREPKPPLIGKELPKPPRYLSKAAKREWRREAKILSDYGLLTAIDLKAFARLCQTYVRLEEAEAGLQKHGLLVKSPNGYPQQSPYFTTVNALHKQLMRILAEFGMTPSSRSRIEVELRNPEDAFEAYLRSGED